MKKLLKLMLMLSLVISLLPSIIKTPTIFAADKVKVAIVQLVSHPSLDEIVAGVKEGLAKGGYKEGDNLEIEFHNAEGDMNLLGSIADTVINNQPDVIFAVTTPVAQAFADATEEIPIVLTGVTDPIAASLVDSLEKPGANITGVSDQVQFEPQFELMLKLKPELKKIGMLYTTSEDSALAELKRAEEVAKKYNLDVQIEGIDSTLDMQLVAENLASQVDAIFIGSDNTIASAFETLLDATDAANIPVFSTVDTFVQQGALSAVAINQGDIGTQAASMGVEILKGAKPAEMPIQLVENLQSVYNGETADRLGILVNDVVKKELKDLSGE